MHNPSLILLAAGISSRMKAPLSEGLAPIDPKLEEEANNLPKCMLSVGRKGRRFMDYLIKNAYEAGYREIILILHPNNTTIEPYVRNLIIQDEYEDLAVHFARQYIPEDREKPYGTGDAVYQAVTQHPPSSGWYTLSNSDNLSSIRALEKAYSCQENTLLSYEPKALNISRERLSHFGLIISHGKHVENLREKPPMDEIEILESFWKKLSINMNLATLSLTDTLPSLSTLVPHRIRNEKEVTDVYSALIRENNLASTILHETIPDLTSKADIGNVQKYLAEAYPDF